MSKVKASKKLFTKPGGTLPPGGSGRKPGTQMVKTRTGWKEKPHLGQAGVKKEIAKNRALQKKKAKTEQANWKAASTKAKAKNKLVNQGTAPRYWKPGDELDAPRKGGYYSQLATGEKGKFKASGGKISKYYKAGGNVVTGR